MLQKFDVSFLSDYPFPRNLRGNATARLETERNSSVNACRNNESHLLAVFSHAILGNYLTIIIIINVTQFSMKSWTCPPTVAAVDYL